jgi:hypothetical protein
MKYNIIIPKEEPRKIDSCYNFNEEIGCVQDICRCEKEEPKQDLEKEMFDLEQELYIPSNLRWHNSKPKQETLTYTEAAKKEERIFNSTMMSKQETLEEKLLSLVKEWRKRQDYYIDESQIHINNEHNHKKFTYKAMATRDCWKELLKLIKDEK